MSQSKLTITCVTRIEQLTETVLTQWNQLSMQSPMQSPAWLIDWWRTFGEETGSRLCVLLVFENDVLTGLAPWYLTAKDCLRFLGDGMTCSDHSTVLARQGQEETVIETVTQWLSQQATTTWHTLRFDAVDQGETIVSTILRNLANEGFECHQRETAGCWTVELPESWDDFLAGLSKNHRKRCRRWKREYFDSGRAELVRYTTEDFRDGWSELAQLNQERREKIGDRSAFADPRFHQFHLSVLPQMLASDQAELRLLKIDGEIAAAEYVMLRGGVVFCYQSGMKTSDNRDGYGNLSILSLLHDAIEHGCRQLDFLRGDEDYKQHWGARRLPCVNHYVAARSFKGTANAACYRTVDWMRSIRNSLQSSLAGS